MAAQLEDPVPGATAFQLPLSGRRHPLGPAGGHRGRRAVGVFTTLSTTRLSGDQWRDLLIFDLQGSVYALVALGYTLVYGVLLMINFAHGDVFMFGG